MTTRPKISTMVTFRQRRCELVDSFVSTYRAEVAEALEALLRDEWNGDEALPAGTLTRLLGPLLRRLKNALHDLVEAEKMHLNEVGNDALPRRRRDQAAAELKQVLFDLRKSFRGLYGTAKAQEMGFEKRIAKNPLTLLRQAQRVYDHLVASAEASEEEREEPRYEGLEIPAEKVLKHLEPPLRELREAMDEVHRELGRVQGTKVAKDQAMEAFDETYLLIVRMLVSAFRLAGQRELAAKLPISLRRPRKTRAAQSAEATPQA